MIHEGDLLFGIQERSQELNVVLFNHQRCAIGEYDFVPDGGIPYLSELQMIQENWLYYSVVFDKDSDVWTA